MSVNDKAKTVDIVGGSLERYEIAVVITLLVASVFCMDCVTLSFIVPFLLSGGSCC